MCACRSNCVSGSDNSFTSSGRLCRVSTFTFDTCSVWLFPDAISKKVLIPTHSEFADRLVATRSEDATLAWLLIQFQEQQCYQDRSKFHSVSYLELYQHYCSFLCQSFQFNTFPKFYIHCIHIISRVITRNTNGKNSVISAFFDQKIHFFP